MQLNYFNFREFKDKYLITNELGFYSFVSEKTLKALVDERFEIIEPEVINELKDRLFIFDQNEDVFIEKASTVYRDNKRYLFSATCLHIFVLTNACNMSCVYCQAQDVKHTSKGMMTKETAKKAVDIALQSPGRDVVFEFQGGEPLSNFPVIQFIIEYAEANKNDKDIHYSMVTNTLLITDEIIDFCKEHNVSISTSLDGNEVIHDNNRKTVAGKGTYAVVEQNIRYMQAQGVSIGAIQTTTKKSLDGPKEIVDTYEKMGLHYIFIRPLTPLGYASSNWASIGYTAEEFLDFYEKCLDEIILLNKSGYEMVEGHAVIFLRKMLCQISDNYMELRSPCGAGVGQVVYYYDGKIYTCDEARMLAEMGMPDFCIGDVDNNYDELMDSKVCKITCQSSVLESIPQCCDCVYHPYCGVCPVINYAKENNLYSRQANGYKCKIYRGILDLLFNYIDADAEVVEIFKKWL